MIVLDQYGNYTTNELYVDGYRIILTDNPLDAKEDNLFERNLFQCFLQVDNKLAWCTITKGFIKNVENFDKLLLKMLLREIDKL